MPTADLLSIAASLQSPLLLAIRLYWVGSSSLRMDGGKLTHLDRVATVFREPQSGLRLELPLWLLRRSNSRWICVAFSIGSRLVSLFFL